MATARRISARDPGTGKAVPVAEFRMEGDKLHAKWHTKSRMIMASIQSEGVVVGSKVYTPAHGRKFYDALPLAYSNSTYIVVEDIEV